jgi:glucose 1-dehydrogenase
MTMRFANKVIIITGAGTGIGFEISRQLAIEGADIILNDINAEAAETAREQIAAVANGQVCVCAGDASEVKFIYAMVAFAVKRFGQVDMAIANAGITVFGNFLDFTEESFQKIVNLNLQGSFFLAQALAKQIKVQKTKGSLLLMSSNIGFQSYPFLSAYAMSKAGIRMLVRSLISELSALQIRINAIAPGATMTERTAFENANYWDNWSKITPLNQIATPNDIAKTALFLLSDDANHITGQTIIVDGGWEATGIIPDSLGLQLEKHNGAQ